MDAHTRIPPEQGRFWLFEYIDADDKDEVRKAVRQNIYYGADAIKLVADNGAFYYTAEEIRAAVEESHAAGRPVSVHVMGGEAARNVILGGADSIEHGFDLSDELLRLMKEKGTWLVGTEFPQAHLEKLDPGGTMGTAKDLAGRIVDRLGRAYRIGVKMAFGSDSVSSLPGKNRADMMLDCLDSWDAAEVPPAATLKALTANAALLLKVEKMRGAIAAGWRPTSSQLRPTLSRTFRLASGEIRDEERESHQAHQVGLTHYTPPHSGRNRLFIGRLRRRKPGI